MASFGRSVVLFCGLLAASPSRADPSAAQAAALESQLRGWLSSLLEPSFALPLRPVQLTADGDHFDILVPIAGLEGDAIPKGVTAIARPGERGIWIVSDIHAPAPAGISFSLPVEGGTISSQHTSWTIGEQHGRMEIDPALGVATRASFAVHALDVRSDSEEAHSRQHYDSYAGEAVAKPTDRGRLDVAQNSRAEGVELQSESRDQPAIGMKARTFSSHGELTGVDPARAGQLLGASVKLLAAASAAMSGMSEPHDPKQLPRMDPGAVRALLVALNGVALGGHLNETIEDLSVRALGQEVTIAHSGVAMGIEAPGGMLRAGIELAAEGFGAPQLPDEYAPLLPKRITLAPVISGVSTADLNRLLMAATQPVPDKPAIAQAIDRIFADGGVRIGLENVVIETNETMLAGTAEVKLPGPGRIQGLAKLRARGLDRLIARVQADPALSNALAFLVFARGLAKPDGDGLAWDIAFDETRRVVVNGTDLSRITPRR